MESDVQQPEQAAFVLAFESTHAAMAAQAAFRAAGASFALIPTPREISAGCGMSLKFNAESSAQARELARTLPPDALAHAALYDADGYVELS